MVMSKGSFVSIVGIPVISLTFGGRVSIWAVADAEVGIAIAGEVYDGVWVDGYSDRTFGISVWCNGKDIVDPVGSGWRGDLCRSGLSDVDQVKLGDFFGESDSDVESDVFHNRWYTGNLL